MLEFIAPFSYVFRMNRTRSVLDCQGDPLPDVLFKSTLLKPSHDGDEWAKCAGDVVREWFFHGLGFWLVVKATP